MNIRIGFAALALLATVTCAYGADQYDGIVGEYKPKVDPNKNVMTIRQSEGKEAGPWRMLGNDGVNWWCGDGVEAKPGGAKVYFLVLKDGPYKGGRFDIMRDKSGNVTALQEVGGPKKTWLPQRAGDQYDGIVAEYKPKVDPNKNVMTIRRSEGKEAGPWRMLGRDGVGSAEVNWWCTDGVEAGPDGARVYFLNLVDGPYKGGRFNIVRDKSGNMTVLQEVGGPKKTWMRQ